MSGPGTVVLRRTWPQRVVILLCFVVIAAALVVAWFVNDVYVSVSDIGRVDISGEILLTDTAPGEPVNFLLIGQDSAAGLAPDDPAAQARDLDPRGSFNADSITILRVDPTSGQAWVVSVPRDLLIDDNGTERKINSTLLVEGPEHLVEVISDNFGIPINHYMSLDFLGFREVVDALDGIPVWFDNPARDINRFGDLASGLDIPTPGCHVLDGVQALQYVRSRGYQELIDDSWEYVGNSDFGRIERQQDFLVLALERAIDRGARNPTTLAALIEAGAESIVLDDELTIAELVDVGEAFSDFNPQNLERFGLEVSTIYDDATGVYLGERMNPEVNEATFEIFRGGADLPPEDDVDFRLYTGADVDPGVVGEFGALGFTVSEHLTIDDVPTETVVIHPPGRLTDAETVARWLLPIPRLIEDPTATGVEVVLGRDHQQVLFLYPHDPVPMRAAVAAHADGPAPDRSDAVTVSGSTSTASTTTASTSTTSASTTVAPTSTSAAPGEADPSVPTTTAGIIGRPPEGQSCG